MSNRFAVIVFVLLLAGGLPAAVVGAVGAPAVVDSSERTGSATAVAVAAADDASRPALADADDVMHRTTTLRHLPEQSGAFEVETTFEVPAPTSGLEIDLEDDAEVRSLEDFERTDAGTYRWTEATDAPTIRYAMPADRVDEIDHRGSDDRGAGGYTFVDAGDWGVVPVPRLGVTHQSPEGVTIGLEETVAVDGPGAAGSDVAFFGPVTEYERTVDGETVRLAVPDAVDLAERPEDVLEELAAASGRLDAGASSPEVFVVAVPSDVDWGPRQGIQYGPSDAWVVADAELEVARNVWLHEYVHTRQRFGNPDVGTAAEIEWLVEAQADYYAALLAYERGLVTFDEFSKHLARGERSAYADDVLAAPSTWRNDDTAYVKGPLVYGEVDRRLRLATDGDRTLEDVFRRLNGRDERVTEADFLDALEDAGGDEVRTVAERYTRTAETPDAWSRTQHRTAFDRERPALEYGLGAAPIEVAGQPWERWDRDEIASVGLEDGGESAGESRTDRGVVAVPAGESVTVPVAMKNADERAGTVDATLEVDGTIVDDERRVLEAGESATAELSWEPSSPGVHDVRVGADRLTVFVRSSPSLTVTDLRLEPEAVGPGESLTATATVATADEYPAAGALAFRSALDPVYGEPIALAPGETGTVAVELTFDEESRYEVVAGERSATATVGGVRSTLESVPGFGVAAGLVALALALAVSVAVLGQRRNG